MKSYIVFDKPTGEIQLFGVCSDADFEAQVQAGISIVEGVGAWATNYVSNDTVQEYTVQQQQAKANRPYYSATWSNKTFEWIDARTEQQKFDEADASARFQRGNLLAQSDWTQIPNGPLTPEQQQAWATYRQALRDVPQQSGYPFNIAWPVAPT